MPKLPSFLQFFYGKPSHRCLILGVDGTGKTTALYRVVLGAVVTTIPTIGFNVETVLVDGNEMIFWDVGGCDKIRPLVQHYMSPGSSILFLVDTPLCISQKDRFDYTLEELLYQCQAAVSNDMLFVGIALVKQDLLPVSENEGSIQDQIGYVVDRVKDSIETIFPGGLGSKYDIYTNEKQGGISAMTGAGLEDRWLFREFLKGIKHAMTGKKRDLKEDSLHGTETGPKIPMTSPPPNQDSARTKPALSIDELRALITKQNTEDPDSNLKPQEFLEKMESGTLEKWDHRAHLRAGFYVLLQHIQTGKDGLGDAAEDFLERLEKMLSNDSKNAEVEKRQKRFRNTVHRTMTTFYLHNIRIAILIFMENGKMIQYEDFNHFLNQNPHLMNSSLWSAYYSKDLLFSPIAKSSWRLPDLNPLPDYVYISQGAVSKGAGGGKVSVHQLVEKDRLQRFAFTTLKRVKSTGDRRGKVIKEALEALQRHTMSLRAKGVNVEPYSETKAYFWIQTLHAAIESLGVQPREWGRPGANGIDITKISYESFILLFPDLMRQRDKGKEVWRLHYTEKSWESMEARMGVVLPSIKPLSNIIAQPSEKERDAAVVREMEIRSLVQGSTERNLSEMELMLHESWVISETQGAPKIAASHGKVLWQIFSKLWKEKLENTTSLGVASNMLVGEDLRGRNGPLGLTEKAFWARVVLKPFISYEITPPGKAGLTGQEENHEEVLRDFRKFIGQNRELSLEDLWKCYYSEETWKSGNAEERFVPPDIKEMSSFS